MLRLLREALHGPGPDGRPLRTQLHRTGRREWTVICDQCRGTGFAVTTYPTLERAEAAYVGHKETFPNG
jgi:hypothetical protein